VVRSAATATAPFADEDGQTAPFADEDGQTDKICE